MSFVVYTDDHPPPHVHVTGRGTAKITLTPIVGVLGARGMSKADTARALAVVKSHRDMMLDAWDRIHG